MAAGPRLPTVASRREAWRLGVGEDDREPLPLVNPFPDDSPAGGAQQQAAVAMAVFVAVFGVDGGAGGEREAVAGDGEDDVAPRFQMHLDPAHRVVPDRSVAEGVDRYVPPQLGVDAMEQVQVEAG